MNKRGAMMLTRSTALRYLMDAGLERWQAEDVLYEIKAKVVNRPAPNTVTYVADDVQMILRKNELNSVRRRIPRMYEYATPSQRSRLNLQP